MHSFSWLECTTVSGVSIGGLVACTTCGTNRPPSEVLKRGVRDRILELSGSADETHPEFRPPYLHIVPLAEIIQAALDVKGVNTMRVQSTWRDFVERFGSEIAVLIDKKVDELRTVDRKVADKINSFRQGWVHYIPGGGGIYGKPIICDSEEEFERRKKEVEETVAKEMNFRGQKTLGEF